MELAQLVIAAQSGDLDAFGQVVGRFQKMACALAYSAISDQHLGHAVNRDARMKNVGGVQLYGDGLVRVAFAGFTK